MKKFSIIILHYNQMDYIEEAFKYTFNQTYSNYEVIFADDATPNFDKKEVINKINKYNKNNIPYIIIDNKDNSGTVKNLNKAIKKATGDYILFYAADDRLYDEKVLEKFVKGFEDEKKKIITSQCIFYDENLKKKQLSFVPTLKALLLNKRSSKKMFEKMAKKCLYASGATAYKKEIFEKYGYFDEKYIYVEDWSYWLKVLNNGEKIYYMNFNSLCHRDGGISHSSYDKNTIPKHVKQYYKDIINIYKNEIFPNFDKISYIYKLRILLQFQETVNSFSLFVPELKEDLKYVNNFKSKKFNSLIWKVATLISIFERNIGRRFRLSIKFDKIFRYTLILWFILSIVLSLIIRNSNIMLTIYVLSYFVIYAFINFIANIVRYYKNYDEGGIDYV